MAFAHAWRKPLDPCLQRRRQGPRHAEVDRSRLKCQRRLKLHTFDGLELHTSYGADLRTPEPPGDPRIMRSRRNRSPQVWSLAGEGL